MAGESLGLDEFTLGKDLFRQWLVRSGGGAFAKQEKKKKLLQKVTLTIIDFTFCSVATGA